MTSKIIWTFAVVLTVGVASGQWIGVGMKIGALASEPFATTSITTVERNFARTVQYVPTNQRLIVGPMVELRLPRRFAVEVSALYRRIEYIAETWVRDITPTDVFLPFDETVSFETRARNLDFPVLIKYRFSRRSVQPFVGAGGAARWVFGEERRFAPSHLTVPVQRPPELRRRWSGGAVAAAGLEWRISVVRIAPEIRYTRWASPSFRNVEGGWFSPANQLELLFSVGF